MSAKKRDQAYGQQRSSALRSSVVLFHRIRDRIFVNRHSAASSVATSTIPKCSARAISQSQQKSCIRRRITLIHQRFVNRFRALHWKFSEFVRRYIVSVLHCFILCVAHIGERLNRLTGR